MSNLRASLAGVVADCVRNGMTVAQMNIVLQNHVRYGYKNNDVITNYEGRYSNFHEVMGSAYYETEDNATKVSIEIIRMMMSLQPFEDLFVLPSIESKGRFSYSRNPEDDDRRRTVTTFGRVIRRQLLIDSSVVKDEMIAKILDIISQKLWADMGRVVVHTGSGVHRAYEYFPHEISCMSGNCYCGEWIDIYSSNECVSCLAVYDDNDNYRCVAKALLWKADSGKLVLDRVYCTDDEHQAAMAIIAKARTMGATVPENSFTRYAGDETLTVEITDLTHVPYLDSFRYVKGHSEKDGRVFAHLGTYGGLCVLDSTEGEGILKCRKCGLNNISYSDQDCGHCGTKLNARKCNTCGEYGECSHVDSELMCNDCRERLTYRCECCHNYKSREETPAIITATDSEICDYCKDRYYKECDICGELHAKNSMADCVVNDGVNSCNGLVCNRCSRTKTSRCGDCSNRYEIDLLQQVVTIENCIVTLCKYCKKSLTNADLVKREEA